MFKKLIVSVVIGAMSASCFAAKFDVNVVFNDGTVKQYAGIDDGPNALQLLALQIQRDFPSKSLDQLASVTSKPAEVGYTPTMAQTYQSKPQILRNQYQEAPTQENKSKGMTAGDLAIGVIAIVVGAGLINALATSGGKACHTGPRGGTYTITSSGGKNYSGC